MSVEREPRQTPLKLIDHQEPNPSSTSVKQNGTENYKDEKFVKYKSSSLVQFDNRKNQLGKSQCGSTISQVLNKEYPKVLLKKLPASTIHRDLETKKGSTIEKYIKKHTERKIKLIDLPEHYKKNVNKKSQAWLKSRSSIHKKRPQSNKCLKIYEKSHAIENPEENITKVWSAVNTTPNATSKKPTKLSEKQIKTGRQKINKVSIAISKNNGEIDGKDLEIRHNSQIVIGVNSNNLVTYSEKQGTKYRHGLSAHSTDSQEIQAHKREFLSNDKKLCTTISNSNHSVANQNSNMVTGSLYSLKNQNVNQTTQVTNINPNLSVIKQSIPENSITSTISSKMGEEKSTQDILAAACSAVGIDEDLDSLMSGIEQSDYSRSSNSSRCDTGTADSLRQCSVPISTPVNVYHPSMQNVRPYHISEYEHHQNIMRQRMASYQMRPTVRPLTPSQIPSQVQRTQNPAEYYYQRGLPPTQPYLNNSTVNMYGRHPVPAYMPDSRLHPTMMQHVQSSRQFYPPQYIYPQRPMIPLTHSNYVNSAQSVRKIFPLNSQGSSTTHVQKPDDSHSKIVVQQLPNRNDGIPVRYEYPQGYYQQKPETTIPGRYPIPISDPHRYNTQYNSLPQYDRMISVEEKIKSPDHSRMNCNQMTQSANKVNINPTHSRKEIVEPPVPLQSIHEMQQNSESDLSQQSNANKASNMNSYQTPNVIRRVSNPVYDHIAESPYPVTENSRILKNLISPSYMMRPAFNCPTSNKYFIQNHPITRKLSYQEEQEYYSKYPNKSDNEMHHLIPQVSLSSVICEPQNIRGGAQIVRHANEALVPKQLAHYSQQNKDMHTESSTRGIHPFPRDRIETLKQLDQQPPQFSTQHAQHGTYVSPSHSHNRIVGNYAQNDPLHYQQQYLRTIDTKSIDKDYCGQNQSSVAVNQPSPSRQTHPHHLAQRSSVDERLYYNQNIVANLQPHENLTTLEKQPQQNSDRYYQINDHSKYYVHQTHQLPTNSNHSLPVNNRIYYPTQPQSYSTQNQLHSQSSPQLSNSALLKPYPNQYPKNHSNLLSSQSAHPEHSTNDSTIVGQPSQTQYTSNITQSYQFTNPVRNETQNHIDAAPNKSLLYRTAHDQQMTDKSLLSRDYTTMHSLQRPSKNVSSNQYPYYTQASVRSDCAINNSVTTSKMHAPHLPNNAPTVQQVISYPQTTNNHRFHASNGIPERSFVGDDQSSSRMHLLHQHPADPRSNVSVIETDRHKKMPHTVSHPLPMDINNRYYHSRIPLASPQDNTSMKIKETGHSISNLPISPSKLLYPYHAAKSVNTYATSNFDVLSGNSVPYMESTIQETQSKEIITQKCIPSNLDHRTSPVILRNPMATPIPESQDMTDHTESSQLLNNMHPLPLAHPHQANQSSLTSKQIYQPQHEYTTQDLGQFITKQDPPLDYRLCSEDAYHFKNDHNSMVMKEVNNPPQNNLPHDQHRGPDQDKFIESKICKRDRGTSDEHLLPPNKVRKCSMESNITVEKAATELFSKNNTIHPDKNKANVILEYPVDELPSCSYSRKNTDCESEFPKPSNYIQNDELFAYSARADTPPTSPTCESALYVTNITKTVYCCENNNLEKYSAQLETSDETGNNTSNGDDMKNPPESSTFSVCMKQSDHKGNTDFQTNLVQENDNDEDDSLAEHDDLPDIQADNSIVSGTQSDNIEDDRFLRLLRPVLSTLLSAPEAKGLRSLLKDPGQLLVELVHRWGGQPASGSDRLACIKKNFDIFLKLFITPDKCSEWGWEGRSTEEILLLLNSDSGAADDKASDTSETSAGPQQEETKIGRSSADLDTDLRQTSDDVKDCLESPNNSQQNNNDNFILLQNDFEHDKTMESLDSLVSIERPKFVNIPGTPVLADTTNTTPSHCSPTSTDQYAGEMMTSLNISNEVRKTSSTVFDRTKSCEFGKADTNNSITSTSLSSGNNNEKDESEANCCSPDKITTNKNEGSTTSSPVHSNTIIKSFATSTTDTLSPICSENTPVSSVSSDSTIKKDYYRLTSFPTLESSPSDLHSNLKERSCSSTNEISTSDDMTEVMTFQSNTNVSHKFKTHRDAQTSPFLCSMSPDTESVNK